MIGIPHARYGEVPRAFVVADKSKKPTEEDIKNFLKGKVADYKELEGITRFRQLLKRHGISYCLATFNYHTDKVLRSLGLLLSGYS